MAQKLFTIHRNCYATIDIEVAAETEEEAMKIARQRFDNIPGNAYDFTENEVSIIDTQDAPDVDELIEQVTPILQFEGHLPISVDIRHTQLEYFGGRACGEHEVLDHADTLYLDNDGELMVMYENDYGSERILDDEPLGELSIEDQISILTDALTSYGKED